jgi:hypothetical protein
MVSLCPTSALGMNKWSRIDKETIQPILKCENAWLGWITAKLHEAE